MRHEQLSIQTHHPIIARAYDYKRFSYPWHHHSEYEIIYIKESTGQSFVADNIRSFHPGDLFLLGPNVPHFLKNTEKQDYEDHEVRARGVIIQFESRFMSHAIDNYAELSAVKLLFEKSKLGIYYPPTTTRSWIQKIEELPTLKKVDRIAALLQLLVLMSDHTAYQQLGSPGFTNTLDHFRGSRMEKIQSYLLHHYTEEINLEKIASLAAMNASAFCRYFKDQSGKTLLEYVMTLRIGFACKLLIGNTQSIAQVALESGFNSIAQFNRIFKRLTGYTPSQYRSQFE